MYKVSFCKNSNEYVSAILVPETINHKDFLEKNNGNVSLYMFNTIISQLKYCIKKIFSKNVKLDFLHGSWPELTVINLSETTLDKFYISAPKLKTIYMSECFIEYFENLYLPEVTDIKILYSSLKSFKNNTFPKLERLNLSCNNLFDISGSMPLLAELNLSGNRLNTSKSLNNFKTLETLDISENFDIKNIQFTDLKNLENLFICDTSIKNVLSIIHLTSLNFIDLMPKVLSFRQVNEKHFNSIYKSLNIKHLPGEINNIINKYYKKMRFRKDVKNNILLQYLFAD